MTHQSNSRGAYQAHLKGYRQGRFSARARVRLAALTPHRSRNPPHSQPLVQPLAQAKRRRAAALAAPQKPPQAKRNPQRRRRRRCFRSGEGRCRAADRLVPGEGDADRSGRRSAIDSLASAPDRQAPTLRPRPAAAGRERHAIPAPRIASGRSAATLAASGPGNGYRSGTGVARDPVEAAAGIAGGRAGNARPVELGTMYESGLGVPKGARQAVAWHRKAAARASPAQVRVGAGYDTAPPGRRTRCWRPTGTARRPTRARRRADQPWPALSAGPRRLQGHGEGRRAAGEGRGRGRSDRDGRARWDVPAGRGQAAIVARDAPYRDALAFPGSRRAVAIGGTGLARIPSPPSGRAPRAMAETDPPSSPSPTQRPIAMGAPEAFTTTAEIGHHINGGRAAGTSGRRQPVFNPATGAVARQVALPRRTRSRPRSPPPRRRSRPGPTRRRFAARACLNAFLELLNEHRDTLAAMITAEHGKVFSRRAGRGHARHRHRRVRLRHSAAAQGRLHRAGLDRHRQLDVAPAARRRRRHHAVQLPRAWCRVDVPGRDRLRQQLHPEAERARPVAVALHGRAAAGRPACPTACSTSSRATRSRSKRCSTHPDVQALSFVGSTPIAQYIYETGARHGKRVQALGGAKNHMVVMPDADLEQAVDALIGAAYGSAGERCMAISRRGAGRRRRRPDRAAARRARDQTLKVKNGMEHRRRDGPLVTGEALRSRRGVLAIGVAEGARSSSTAAAMQVAGHEEASSPAARCSTTSRRP